MLGSALKLITDAVLLEGRIMPFNRCCCDVWHGCPTLCTFFAPETAAVARSSAAAVACYVSLMGGQCVG
jgi:hypothetical protein